MNSIDELDEEEAGNVDNVPIGNRKANNTPRSNFNNNGTTNANGGSSKLNSDGTASGSSSHLSDKSLLQINPLWSGIAFYVDLHGHAARRGCFIYGNSIDNELLQIENVLYAKLIAFNTQHFDFDGCNFSVRNMLMKDKREGLSKEGSGRVAMLRHLGILHSYTLECCYASGRVMNTIVPAANTLSMFNNRFMRSISPPLHSDVPPKFEIAHYGDVGKALAIAALDLIELNPFSRVPNTSFGSLEVLRNWIKFFIRSKMGGGIQPGANPAAPPAAATAAAAGSALATAQQTIQPQPQQQQQHQQQQQQQSQQQPAAKQTKLQQMKVKSTATKLFRKKSDAVNAAAAAAAAAAANAAATYNRPTQKTTTLLTNHQGNEPAWSGFNLSKRNSMPTSSVRGEFFASTTTPTSLHNAGVAANGAKVESPTNNKSGFK